MEPELNEDDEYPLYPIPTIFEQLKPVLEGEEQRPPNNDNDEYTKECENPHYEIAVSKIQRYLNSKPQAVLGPLFWNRLTPDERIAIYQDKAEFVELFLDSASINQKGEKFLIEEWIETKYRKGLYIENDYGAKHHLAYKVKKEMRKMSSAKAKSKKIAQNYERLEGFKNLQDVERQILFLALFDKRDGTNKAHEFIQDEGIDINVDDLLDRFWRSGHVHSYKQRLGTVFGVRALATKPQDNDEKE